jgi:YgiT-type zinc finger domain-containing protein
MTCEVCGVGGRREQSIRYSLSIGDGLVVIDHVPATVCDHCGETSLRPEIVASLQRTIWQKRPPARVIETPVYEFAL